MVSLLAALSVIAAQAGSELILRHTEGGPVTDCQSTSNPTTTTRTITYPGNTKKFFRAAAMCRSLRIDRSTSRQP